MGVEWLASQLKFPSSRVKPQRGGLPRCSNALRSGGIMVTFISSSKVGGLWIRLEPIFLMTRELSKEVLKGEVATRIHAGLRLGPQGGVA